MNKRRRWKAKARRRAVRRVQRELVSVPRFVALIEELPPFAPRGPLGDPLNAVRALDIARHLCRLPPREIS